MPQAIQNIPCYGPLKKNWYIVYTDLRLTKDRPPLKRVGFLHLLCLYMCVYTHVCNACQLGEIRPENTKSWLLWFTCNSRPPKYSSNLFAGRKSCPKFVKKNKKPSICEAWQSQVKQKEICLCKCELQTVLHLQQCLRWNCGHKITFV